MVDRFSLRARLSLLLVLVLAAGLAAGLGALVMHAGARIGAESDAAIRLARELVETKAPQLEAAADPQAELEKLFADVRRLRHVRIGREGAPQPFLRDRVAPEWFTALVMPTQAESRIATPVATIVVSSNPLDEIDEVWQEIVWLATGALALALIALWLGSLGLSRALRPVAAVADSLSRLEGGDYAIRLAPEGPPEFVDIAERINALAATLQGLDADNRTLVQRMIDVQEQERRDIARDLHDEIGPFLFTARASIGALARKATTQSLSPAQLAAECARIDAQIAALQEINRRILGRLRPPALEEMGLADAVAALARGWQDTHPDIVLTVSTRRAGDGIDDGVALAAYRVVQEGLTNAYRHAGAKRIEVSINDGPAALEVIVQDDGGGLSGAPANQKGTGQGVRQQVGQGLGLRGMAERLAALGGSLHVEQPASGGLRLVATIPATQTPTGST
jgi:two-component system sensor histidine kinase UhpB